MTELNSTIVKQLAQLAKDYQHQRTGHLPGTVSVDLSDNAVIVTLHEALTPAEKALSKNPAGAAQVQEFHRQLFIDSSHAFRTEITRLTGRQVREATAEMGAGPFIHAFTTGTIVQMFLLAPGMLPITRADSDSDRMRCADDDGFRLPPDVTF
jgi:uncharacterized protein YbcI